MLRISALKKVLARKQGGFVITAEVLLITTILVLGLVTGWAKVRDQVLAELSDTGAAIGAINQSYTIMGTEWAVNGLNDVAEVSGFAFNDTPDDGTGSSVGGDGKVIHYDPAAVADNEHPAEVGESETP